jgi:perosamine synthetase
MIKERLFGNEMKYLQEVLDAGFRASSGAFMMKRFEQAFSERFGMKHGVAFVNGTATMHAALESWGIGEGDEVIVPPLTMASTTFAVLQCNATPVYADIDPDTFQISADSIAKNITEKTKAIITVAIFGLSPDMSPIMALARKHGLKVLEDNAECFLGKYNDQLVGTIGDCASFSFQNSKHLTSGEGGIVITDDDDFADKLRKVVSLGYAGVSAKSGKVTRKDIQDPNYERHAMLGWNYRMPDLCCAVALAQVENIDALVDRRMQVGKLFEEVVHPYREWFKPQFTPDNCVHSYWTFVAQLLRNDLNWHEFRDEFQSNGGDGVYACWKLTYDEPFMKHHNFLNRERYINRERLENYRTGICPIAEKVQPNLFQFKTNYWDYSQAEKQAEILAKTLAHFHQ